MVAKSEGTRAQENTRSSATRGFKPFLCLRVHSSAPLASLGARGPEFESRRPE
jgi:hypothetical protein